MIVLEMQGIVQFPYRKAKRAEKDLHVKLAESSQSVGGEWTQLFGPTRQSGQVNGWLMLCQIELAYIDDNAIHNKNQTFAF